MSDGVTQVGADLALGVGVNDRKALVGGGGGVAASLVLGGQAGDRCCCVS